MSKYSWEKVPFKITHEEKGIEDYRGVMVSKRLSPRELGEPKRGRWGKNER